MRLHITIICVSFLLPLIMKGQDNKRLRDFGIEIGVMTPGPLNMITDVPGVAIGHNTLLEGDDVRTGVTAILPHEGNLFQSKVPAAIHVGNGFGKLAGSTQVEELGNLETPIILTNTLSVPTAVEALIDFTLSQTGNENVRSVNALVGETNDGYLNDIRGRHVKKEHVLGAIDSAKIGAMKEGNVGAGTGTSCFGYKGGIGTSSRVLPSVLGGYTIGVIVQTNFGGVLRINGIPVAKELGAYPFKEALEKSDGSCMIVVATNAPLQPRNLKRIAKRAILGMGNTGGIASNGSGDYVIAFSTYAKNFVPYRMESFEQDQVSIHNDAMSSLFMAVIEATEEAILNSLCAAESMVGRNRHFRQKLPMDKVMEIMK